MHASPPGTYGPATRYTSRARRRRHAWKALGAAMSACVLAASAAFYAEANSIIAEPDREDVFQALDEGKRPQETKHNAMNVLLVGSDDRSGLTDEEIRKYHLGRDGLGGSDTVMLVHISRQHDKATIVSFPRDLLVDIPALVVDGDTVGGHQHKLNTAYAEGGPQLTIATLEQYTGLRIDHYLQIDVPNFGKMVDDLGGVDVCLPVDVNDDDSNLNLPAGRHTLDGVDAVAYVRMRKQDTGEGVGDFGRMRRQQKFLASMMNKVISAETLFNISETRQFLRTLAGSITMDEHLSTEDMFTIATQLQGLDPRSVTFATVPAANMDYRVGEMSTVLADEERAQSLFEAIREDRAIDAKDFRNRNTVDPSLVQVQVLNGSGIGGAAGQTAAALEAMGFTMAGDPANADSSDHAETTIRYAGARLAEARTLQKAIPGVKLQVDDSVGDTVVLTIGANFTGTRDITQPEEPAEPVETHTAADDPCATA